MSEGMERVLEVTNRRPYEMLRLKPTAKVLSPGDPNHKHLTKIVGNVGRCSCGRVVEYNSPTGKTPDKSFGRTIFKRSSHEKLNTPAE
jgi:hypothetical protein